MVPVMIVTLFAALQELSIVTYLYKGFPAGLVLSGVVAFYWLKTTPARVDINGARVRILTIWECYRNAEPGWAYIIDLDESDDGRIRVTVGLDSFTLVDSQWKNVRALREGLRTALRAYHDPDKE